MKLDLKTALLVSCLASTAIFTPALAAKPLSTNLPLTSQHYEQIQKLEAMGYVKQILPGSKPFSRIAIAQLTIEASTTAKDKPTPQYIKDIIQQLETSFAKEIDMINGQITDTTPELKTITLETAYYGADSANYSYNSPAHKIGAKWQPFTHNNNGNRYDNNFNYSISAEVYGNLGHSTAISLTPRIGYSDNNNNKVNLQEGYLKLKNGSVSVEFGKQALFWGQGKDASLILGNAATPLTMLRVNLEDPEPIGGFFKFLGRNTSQIFVASLESDRAARALANGNQKDYDRATLLGLRTDFMPTDNFTFGLTRVSMLGGKAHGLSSHDWKDWFLGTNANSSEADRWNDIAGIDFRYRFPALEVYGELYGEDQAGYLPSQTAQKLGFYLPRLTRDGAWDLNLEYSKTTSVWYDHSAFQNGWTYKDSLLGDYMGPNAEKYLLTLGHYQSGKQQFMLNASTMKMERNTITPQKVHELSLTHKFLLQDNLSLKTQIGIAKIDNAGFKNHHNETTRFLGLSLNYTY